MTAGSARTRRHGLRSGPERPNISVVVPAFNESENLPLLVERLAKVLDIEPVLWSLTIVDDGSTDDSVDVIRDLHARDSRVKGLVLSRNFGKEFALAAGIDAVSADALVVLDADLQHPPEVIPDLLSSWRRGHKVVFAQRLDRAYQGPLRRAYAYLYYRLFSTLAGLKLPRGIGDFVLLDRQAVAVMKLLGERARFNKGLYSWIGFRSAFVPFVVADRNAGRSQWSIGRLLRFAVDGLVSFSAIPLRISALFGIIVSLGALLYAAYLVSSTLLFGTDLPGFPTLIVSIMFFAGVQLVFLGILGEYISRVFDEVKRRPLFIVEERIGLDLEDETIERRPSPWRYRDRSVRRRLRYRRRRQPRHPRTD